MGLTYRHFESGPCSRCGGTGTWSYTPQWGNTCFRCGTMPHVPGSGISLTKLGAKAREAWLAANIDTVPVTALRSGDTVIVMDRKRLVAEVKVAAPGENFGSAKSGSDPVRYFTVGVVVAGVTHLHTDTETMDRWVTPVRLPLPPEMDPGTDRKAEMKALIAAALTAKAA